MIWGILAFNAIYLVIFGVAGRFYKDLPFSEASNHLRFALFIPAYKGDEVILHSAQAALELNYPKESFDVIVIGDHLMPETIARLQAMPLVFVPVAFEKSTKAKSLNAAIEKVRDRNYDYAVIFDIDNIAEPDYLKKLNAALSKGQQALQTHRMAKNEDTDFSVLDGISEEINNHLFRKGHKVLKLSAAFIGSGKAIAYPLFTEVMKKLTAVGGFDKQMEILLISKGIRIDYVHDIYLYDEKVQNPGVFQNQRKRWMSAQLTYMRKYALSGIWNGLITGNLDLVDKALQLTLLPRLIAFGANVLLCLSFFPDPILGIFTLVLCLLQLLTLLLCTPKKYYKMRTLKALIKLPYMFVLMFVNLFRLRGANKRFIHTPHKTV